jgi:predicted secreted Zn-dependent protease
MRMALLRRLFPFLLAAALAGFSAPGARAKIVFKENTGHYTVTGLSGIDLGRSMLIGGAQTINMRHAIASTTTQFDFLDPVLAIEHGRCVVKDVTVQLNIKYQLPKWSGRDRASPGLRRAWDAFYAKLVSHEHTHGQIARNFSKKVEREMLNLSGTVVLGCKDFGAFSAMRFSALSRELKQLQLAFDRREDRADSEISRRQTTLLRSR